MACNRVERKQNRYCSAPPTCAATEKGEEEEEEEEEQEQEEVVGVAGLAAMATAHYIVRR